ncbi:hypothetical protein NC651_027316 [Populus alba x Populus x berolinensis]|nr:hypothetical protein NC651_027316 [Populus alba x Populus x berolinensis]
MGNEEKTAAVHEEIKRMNQLPATSSYVSHRLLVLNKILQLVSIQRLPLAVRDLATVIEIFLTRQNKEKKTIGLPRLLRVKLLEMVPLHSILFPSPDSYPVTL